MSREQAAHTPIPPNPGPRGAPVTGRGDGLPNNKAELIVETAAGLFDTAGYSSTSMSAIANEVGLAKATLYHYFTSKADILVEIHETFLDPLIEAHLARLATSVGPVDQLIGAMTDILTLMEVRRGHVRVFFEHHRELPKSARRSLVRRRARYQEMIAEIFRAGMREGVFRSVDPELAALAVFGMCNWAYQWWKPGTGRSPERVARTFASMLIEGVGIAEGRVEHA